MTKRVIFKIIILAVGFAAALFIYRALFVSGEPSEPPGVEATSARPSGAPVDDEFLRLLDRLEDIELDAEAVFNHPVWDSLVNFRRALVSEPAGRKNPFAPPGFDAGETATTSTSATTTRGR
ncbi:MAG: hypothetical protein HYT46_01425 [Candidatus Vogelbacteria bacterium]|nr:hypothetical protein [Candidatus Vogelbacteria bacterium]